MEKLTKQMKNGDVRQIAYELEGIWNQQKNEIKISGRALYNLIALKKRLQEESTVITESFMVIGQNNGGVLQENGSMKIPDENIAEVNKLLSEVANEEISIEYSPIKLVDSDNLPSELMELLFDFIEFAD